MNTVGSVRCPDHHWELLAYSDQRQFIHCHACQLVVERFVDPGDETNLNARIHGSNPLPRQSTEWKSRRTERAPIRAKAVA